MCKYKHYPVGHPTCLVGPILDGYTIDNLEGLVRCTVVPPRNLFIPLLPAKINKKLVFTLCRVCAENKQTTLCNHTERQRALTGCWVSFELQKAKQIGYKILQIHEAWHYSKTTVYDKVSNDGGLFATYMNTFIKLKLEASGYPRHVLSDAEKDAYIENIQKSEGVRLDKNNIEKNAGKRISAKLCLNNLWGKMGQRNNMQQTSFIRQPQKFFDLLSSDETEINDCFVINDDVIFVKFKHAEHFAKSAPNTNAIVASYVTAHGRLALYSYLEKLGKRTLYYDTDSVIYKSMPGMYDIPLGDCMGDMTDELDGEYITEFTSTGAKSYAYKTNAGTQSVKCKGFTLNKITSDVLTFETLRDMATGVGAKSITVKGTTRIRPDVKRRRVCTELESKSYTRTLDKRILKNDHHSIPYGYRLVM